MSLTASSENVHRLPAVARRRRRISFDLVAHIAAVADILAVVAASFVAVLFYHQLRFGFMDDPSMNVGAGLLTAVIFVLAMSSIQAYSYDSLSSIGRQLFLIFFLFPTVLAFVLAIVFFLKMGETFSRGAILYLAITSMVALIGIRLALYRWLGSARARTLLLPHRAFIICPEDMPQERLQYLSELSSAKIAAVTKLSEDTSFDELLRERLAGIGARSGIDEIVVIWRDGNPQLLENLLLRLRQAPLPVKIVFDSLVGSVTSCPRAQFGDLTAFQVQSSPLGPLERLVKRGFDIAFAATALLLLSPMLLLVAIAIKLDSPGPALFLQRRLGHGNQPFRIVKFRSMRVLEDGDTVRQATVGDARITRIGGFIRAYSIDELPQFWNVLRGDMSVVGPRPHAVAHDNLFDSLIAEYASRRHVKPGVTGWAQVHGHRGETPGIELMARRVEHDRWYIDNWSLWLDMKIVMRTFFALRGH
ncbi:exopolysaccharide biosynthesis polyprenyl glycosylphosphotransferase [Corticibacterium sp. UT-5YL-CI-8]|nr:exopolysaccharide biosynthesis polyprenyl glycosylphosphotransferase [Tianweitania sp. UT-5YL-CI-8]